MKIKIISNILYYLIRLLNATYRYQYVGLENKEKARQLSPNRTFVYAIWHQNLVAGILSHCDEPYTMIISESKDGELVAVTCQKFGHNPARGSSTRGGKKALIEVVKKIKAGFPAALTVDGPKGPSKVVKPGVIEMARLSRSPIITMSPYPTRFWTFKKSWDQFRFPKPFSKIVVVIGEPIIVDDSISREHFNELALTIANKINEGEVKARKILGLV